MAALLDQSSLDCRNVQLSYSAPLAPAVIRVATPSGQARTPPPGVVLGTAVAMPGAVPLGAEFRVSSQDQSAPRAPPQYKIYNAYGVSYLFDVMIVVGTLGLIICYIIARHYKHVGVFCDISDLVIHMPERVLFRLNFSLVGGFLTLGGFPIRDVVARRLHGKAPQYGCFFQIVSGVGVILVAACGPTECMWFHVTAAVMGFAGSGIAQIIYGFALVKEDSPTPGAKRLFILRCCLSLGFIASAVVFGLGQAGVFPEPTEHIFEWALWFFLLLWYYTFRFDMSEPGESFYIATVKEIAPQCYVAPVQGFVL